MIVGKRSPLGGWLGPPALFLAPALILFLLLFAIPAVSSLYVSLCKWQMTRIYQSVSSRKWAAAY